MIDSVATAVARPRRVAPYGLGRRIRLGILACAALLVLGTVARGGRLLRARVPAGAVEREVGRGLLRAPLLVAPSGDGWTVQAGGGPIHRLRRDQGVSLAGARSLATVAEGVLREADPRRGRTDEPPRIGHAQGSAGADGGVEASAERPERNGGRAPRLRVRRAAGEGVEILRVPWSVFGGSRGGHQRIDFGADPLGERDGVRDRVVLPASPEGPGWFHLVPPEDGRAFGPDDRSARLVAERSGLRVVVAGRAIEPGMGEVVAVGGTTSVAADGVVLTIAWESTARARVLRGAGGRVLGYGGGRAAVDFVVRSRSGPAAGHPELEVLSADGVLERVPLSESSPTLIHGPGELLGALWGRVLPGELRDLRLEAAVREGLRAGWIHLRPGGSTVDIPRDGDEPRADLGWPLSREVVAVVERYDRAVSPLALRLLGGVSPSGSRAGEGGLRFDRDLDAWLPSARPRGGAPATFDLAVLGGAVTVATARPARWRPGGEERWRRLPPPATGTWRTYTLDPGDAARIELRLEPLLLADRPRELSFSIAGGPDGAALRADGLRWGTRAYPAWEEPGRGRPAASLWSRIPGDRWAARQEVPAGGRAPRTIFVRVPLRSPSAGWVALDVALPGPALRAAWNGEERDDLPLPAGPGLSRLSLRVRPGDNLLALTVELPAEVPALSAGRVRFSPNPGGAPAALDPSVALRRARPSVRAEEPAPPRRGAPELLVERGPAGLPPGTRWSLAPSVAGEGTSELILPDAPGVLRRDEEGELRLSHDGLRFRSRSRRSLGAVRPIDGDPSGVAVAGQRIAPGQEQALQRVGEAVEGPGFLLRALPSGDGVLRGSVVVVGAGAVAVSGAPAWATLVADEAPALRLAAFTRGQDVWVAVNRPASLWTARGERIELPTAVDPTRALGPTPWPAGARLVIDGAGLRLRRPGTREPQALPSWAQGERATVEPDLQAAAGWALRSQVPPQEAGDGELLAGALLAMNARTGDILACASQQRAVGDERSRLLRPCWQDGGYHPGSTFKVATAAAALGSEDPVVVRMLAGDLPEGLRAVRTSLRGARLPGEGGRALRSRLRNFHGHAMAPDTDLEAALRSSLNTWFGYLGLLLDRPTREGWGGAALATEAAREAAWPVARVAHAAGFGRRIDLGLGEHGTGGTLPASAPASDAPLAARSVGQDAVSATPLGVAGLLALAAGDGSVPTPRLSLDRPEHLRAVLSPAEAARLRGALLGVVRRGTARRAFADNPYRARILGKTGSAQRIDRSGLPRTDAWFGAAILPPEGSTDDPVVVVALLPGAGLGGLRAAEAVDQFSRDLVALRGWR